MLTGRRHVRVLFQQPTKSLLQNVGLSFNVSVAAIPLMPPLGAPRARESATIEIDTDYRKKSLLTNCVRATAEYWESRRGSVQTGTHNDTSHDTGRIGLTKSCAIHRLTEYHDFVVNEYLEDFLDQLAIVLQHITVRQNGRRGKHPAMQAPTFARPAAGRIPPCSRLMFHYATEDSQDRNMLRSKHHELICITKAYNRIPLLS